MLRYLKLILAVGVLASTTAALAAEPSIEDMQKTVAELQARLKAQQERLDQIEGKVDEDMKSEMAKVARELADDADQHAALPGWLDNLKFFADLRLRYQTDCGDDAGGGPDFNVPGSRRQKNRNRARFRLRFGFIKTWLDEQFEVGFRLASGDPAAATSANQTFTNVFSRKEIDIDWAYAKYAPKCVPGLAIIGGKMPNPLVHTDMVWDSDVSPEGFVVAYSRPFGPIEPNGSVGFFLVKELGPTWDQQYDTTLWSYQAGFNWDVCDGVRNTFAATYYDYDHMTLLLGEQFQCINLTNKVGFSVMKIPVSVYGDLIYNCNFDNRLNGDSDQDKGCAVGVKVGRNEKKGDWSVFYKWAYIEAFATPGVLNDTDFNSTNSKGHVIGGAYNITDFLTVGARVFLTEVISGAAEGVDEVTTQIDMVWKL